MRDSSTEEKEQIKQHIDFYKANRKFILNGDLYRLLNPLEGNEAAWMFVSPDKSEALMLYCRILAVANIFTPFIRLQGLKPDKQYRLELTGPQPCEHTVRSGDELMNVGLKVPNMSGDFQSVVWILSLYNSSK